MRAAADSRRPAAPEARHAAAALRTAPARGGYSSCPRPVLQGPLRPERDTPGFVARDARVWTITGNLSQGEVAAVQGRDRCSDISSSAALDCDEGGPLRCHAQRVIEERVQGGPSSCCMLVWI